MQDLLQLILSNITTQPDAVKIEMTQEEGREIYNITVSPEDMGRVIGKSGKVIQAIRSIMHVASIRNNTRVRVNVVEIEDNQEANQVESDLDLKSTAEATPEASVATEEVPAQAPAPESTPAEVAPEPAESAPEQPAVTEETPVESDIDLISGAIDLNQEEPKKD